MPLHLHQVHFWASFEKLEPLIVRIILLIGLFCPTFAASEVTLIEHDTALRGVYLIDDPKSQKVVVQAFVVAGEVDATGPEGISHYLEHLMFWHAEGGDPKKLHGRGGNAWVNGLITTYYNTGTAREMDEMLVFARRLLEEPKLKQQFMLQERNVVQREYDLSQRENIDRQAYDISTQHLYKGHPLHRRTLGDPTSIGQLTIDQAFGLWAQTYSAGNIILVFSGNLQASDITAEVNRTFGDVPRGGFNEQAWRGRSLDALAPKTVTLTDKLVSHAGAKHSLITTWGRNVTEDRYTIWIASELLNSSLPGGGLHGPLRTDEFIVSGFDLWIDKPLHSQIRMFFAGRSDLGVDPERVPTALKAALRKLSSTGVRPKSLLRIKERIRQREQRLSQDMSHQIGRVANSISAGFDPISVKDHLDAIDDVTKEAVDSLLRALTVPEREISILLKKE